MERTEREESWQASTYLTQPSGHSPQCHGRRTDTTYPTVREVDSTCKPRRRCQCRKKSGAIEITPA
eukprot:3451439-Rhodomonas_salina.1